MSRVSFAAALWAIVLSAALGGCHLLYPFERQEPLLDLALPADVGAVDANLDSPLNDAAAVANDVDPVDAAPPPPDSGPDAGTVLLDAYLNSITSKSCDYTDTAGGLAPAGVCTITATMTNPSNKSLRPRRFVVLTLTNGNLLLNADGGPGGAGSVVTVPAAALGPDGTLTPGETFAQAFQIGLKVKQNYGFYLNLLGDVLP